MRLKDLEIMLEKAKRDGATDDTIIINYVDEAKVVAVYYDENNDTITIN